MSSRQKQGAIECAWVHWPCISTLSVQDIAGRWNDFVASPIHDQNTGIRSDLLEGFVIRPSISNEIQERLEDGYVRSNEIWLSEKR